MQSEVKLLLLKLVRYNGNLSPLIKLGYEYSQIIHFINLLIKDNLLLKTGNKIIVTGLGISEIEILNKKLERTESAIWIEPDIGSKVSQIDVNDVFLPDQDELSF